MMMVDVMHVLWQLNLKTMPLRLAGPLKCEMQDSASRKSAPALTIRNVRC